MDLPTQYRRCGFYLAWFHRLYRFTDNGWQVAFTPNGKPIAKQDAYFWRALEVIAVVKNLMFQEEQARG